MNLEELKYIWQEHSDEAVETMQVNAAEIRAMLQSRSKSALFKIKRNIALDLGAFFLLCIAGLAWIFTSNIYLSPAEIAAICLFAATSLVFYTFKLRALNRVAITSDNLRTSLSAITGTLDNYMKLYRLLVVYFVPVLGSGGVLYGAYKAGQEDGRTLADIPPAVWALLFVVMILYSVFAVFASRWYVHKMFGIHYQELKACLNELEE
ncbi:MAG: hypothetical protein R3C61_11500 [Bacteroidia bacterium]